MQDDLSDGVKWAVDKGLADPSRVVISGASYGGYATMAGLAFTPELYPTTLRASGMGIAGAMARLGGLFAPISREGALVVKVAAAE